MNKKFLILPLTVLGFAALLFSCSDSVVANDPSRGDASGNTRLRITVLDNSDSKPVAADLDLLSANKQAKTENGIAIFEGLNPGEHLLQIDAGAGYAAIIAKPNVQEMHELQRTQESQETYSLFPKSATIKGYVQYKDKTGTTKPANNLKVRVRFNDEGCYKFAFAENLSREVEITNGKFEISDLPAIGNCSYQIETTGGKIDGKDYNAMALNFVYEPLKNGGTADVGIIDLDDGKGIFTLMKYNREIEVGKEETPVVFDFSENIAANQQGKISVSSNTGIVGYNVKIEGATITLTPATKWNAGWFDVAFTDLLSESGKPYGGSSSASHRVTVFSKDISGETVEPKLLTKPEAITYYTGYNGSSFEKVEITFKRVEGATDYRFYLEEKGKISLIRSDLVSEGTHPSRTDLIYYVPIAFDSLNATGKPVIGSKTNKIIVQPYNAQFETKLELARAKALSVSETEKRKPNYASGVPREPICEPQLRDGEIISMNCRDNRSTPSIADFWNSAPTPSALDEILTALGSAAQFPTAENQWIVRRNILFNRGMDTTKTPSYDGTTASCEIVTAGTQNPCAKLDIEYEWLNEQVLNVKLRVKKDGALLFGGIVDAKIKISNLFGANGEPFEDGLIELNLNGSIPQSCRVNPFVETCSTADSLAYCNKSVNFYNNSRCKEAFPDPCEKRMDVPILDVFYEPGESRCTKPPKISVKIGSQTWMAKNMDIDVGVGSKCYDNNPRNCDIYGRLYDWATAMALPSKCNSTSSSDDSDCAIKPNHQGICPNGYHIPSYNEWETLV